MKKTWALVLMLSLLPAAGAMGAGEVTTPAGALQIDLAAKWVYAWSLKDDDSSWPGRDGFTTSLVDAGFSGRLTDQVSYNLELAASYNPERNQGGLAGFSNPNEIGMVGVRQASITFSDLVPWSTFKIGTFIPRITNYMGRPVTQLDLIQYPLLNAAANMDPDLFVNDNRPAQRNVSPWQQAGFNVTITPPWLMSIDFGMYNGMMPNGDANFNPDLAMAKSLAITFTPDYRTSFSLATWTEQFLQDYPGVVMGAKRDLTIFYLYGSYQAEIIEITADYCQGNAPRFLLGPDGAFRDLSWETWQVTAGYWILPELEVLARYESFNPDTLDSVQHPASRYDKADWLTIGLNYNFLPQAQLAVNYVHKESEGLLLEDGVVGRDPLLPNYDFKYNTQNDDLILVQVMVWQ